MPVPDTRDGLTSVGYTYTGSSICRRCGKEVSWFITPRGVKMGMSAVAGTEDDDPQRLEYHRCEGK